MSSFASNNPVPTDSLFKKPSGFPSRSRKNFDNSRSSCKSCNPEPTENTEVIFKKLEERYEVLKKLCEDQPDDLNKMLNETVERFTQVVYEKVADKVLPSLNPRSSAPASYYGQSFANIQDPAFESTRRKVNSTTTSKNHYGLFNAAIPEDRPASFFSGQFSRASDAYCQPEPPQRTLTNKESRSKRTATSTTNLAEKIYSAVGLIVPLQFPKPNPPATQSKRSSKKQSAETRELEVLPSEDEGDSLSVFFGKGRTNMKQSTTARSKQSDSKKPTKSHDLSITLQRIPVNTDTEAAGPSSSDSHAGPSRKRKAAQSDEAPSRKKSPVTVEEEKRPSPDTTSSNMPAQKPAKAGGNETLRRSNRNTSVLSIRKQVPAAASKENKENREKPKKTTAKPKSQKVAKNPSAKMAPVADKGAKTAPVVEEAFRGFVIDAKSNNGEGVGGDDASFFGDVSSIVGADSLVLTNTVAKNLTKNSAASRTDMPSHFFSPFANIRSTSGVSAISTPLSKTLTKNVLGKRVKKPNAVAEFKNAQTRKPRKARAAETDMAPVPENDSESSEESESELEGSDFSS